MITPRDNFGQIWKLKRGNRCDAAQSEAKARPKRGQNRPDNLFYKLPIVWIFPPSVCVVGAAQIDKRVDKRVDRICVDGIICA